MTDCEDQQHYFLIPIEVWDLSIGARQVVLCNCGESMKFFERTQANEWEFTKGVVRASND